MVGFKDPSTIDMKDHYPAIYMVTAPSIEFSRVSRKVIAVYKCMHEKSFTKVYLTGIVGDQLGSKMSKSLGNSPDPIDVIK